MVPIRRHAGNWRTYLAGGRLVLKNSLLLRLLAVFIIVSALALGLLSNTDAFKECARHYKAKNAQERVEQKSSARLSADIALVSRFNINMACTGDAINGNKDTINAISSFLVAVFTGTLWISTHLLWRAASNQARDTRRSIAVARSSARASEVSADLAREALNHSRDVFLATERPWIDMNAVDGSVVFGADTFNVQVFLAVRNVGKVPAICILAEPRIFVWTSKKHHLRFDPLSMQQEAISKAMSSDGSYGQALFPEGDPMVLDHTITTDNAELGEGHTPSDFVHLFFLGCVGYRQPGRNGVLYTSFSFRLARDASKSMPRPGRAPGAIFPDDGNVPLGHLKLTADWEGWTAT